MSRVSKGKRPDRLGADGEDILNILNVIHKEFDTWAEISTYVALDGRLFVEAHCDMVVDGKLLQHMTYGRHCGNNQYPYDTMCMIVLHNLYALLDRAHLALGGRTADGPSSLGK